MYKVIGLLKRRAGMSMSDFISYYENGHSKIGDKYFPGRAEKYIRRFFRPLPHPVTASPEKDPEFDAIVEMWFKSEKDYQETMAIFLEPELAKFVVEDESRLFQRDKIRMFVVEEHESDLKALLGKSDQIELRHL